MVSSEDVLKFWFEELTPDDWFSGAAALDERIRHRFLETQRAAARGELWAWRRTLDGRVAEILVLDQFPRNIFRGLPESFAGDAQALILAQEAVAAGVGDLPPEWRSFVYMPYMHSESLAIHDEAVRLFSQPGLESNLDFELRHRRILEQFGRYPHRNKILGRTSTPAELEFMKTNPGF